MSVILERILKHADGHELRIKIGVPARIDDAQGDWQCDYQIDGFGSSKVRSCFGVDAIQAITLALTYVSTTLYFSEEYQNGKIIWEGGMSPSDLGLPVADNVSMDVNRIRSEVDYLQSAPSE